MTVKLIMDKGPFKMKNPKNSPSSTAHSPLPRGYKQTEVGLIPEDWYEVTLGSITVLMTNGFVGNATSHYTSEGNGVLYIQGYNVEENSFDFSGIKFVTEAFHKAHLKSCLRADDLLTVQTGDVGLTTIVSDSFTGSNCHALIISRFNQAIPDFTSQLGRLAAGTKVYATTRSHIASIELMLPPISEQTAIAEILSDIDTEIAALETKLTKTRQIKQDIMQELLTGKTRLV